ncbi:hypothetical protein [Aureibacter tunicatorum]|uniref:DUF4468 domain-containing protein n=1 Tax=Aureibacter tunicatorum TaxID=866807 RepID=A0AAE3XI51_9BACT|nr:hypothetical protein [Aureibacter tunicatorum]MDR6237273.1 hypothetical protein [Aureibacter tunicatorum]BDD06265.1 hypothetical protein AUTU_37480 [Aureibacter tunicatorum]
MKQTKQTKLFAVIMMIVAVMGTASAKDVYVTEHGFNGTYSSVQDAIRAAGVDGRVIIENRTDPNSAYTGEDILIRSQNIIIMASPNAIRRPKLDFDITYHGSYSNYNYTLKLINLELKSLEHVENSGNNYLRYTVDLYNCIVNENLTVFQKSKGYFVNNSIKGVFTINKSYKDLIIGNYIKRLVNNNTTSVSS